MSIFESKPQIFWRKVREAVKRFFVKIGTVIRKFQDEFRALPQGSRRVIGVGSSLLALLVVFAVFWWPMLQRPKIEEVPERKTVAEAITRIDLRTQTQIPTDRVPEIIEEIEDTLTRSINDREIVQLHILRFKIYFNAGLFYRAAMVGQDVRALDSELVGTERFEIYHLLVAAYRHIGDTEQRRYYAQLVLDEFDNGNIEDLGSRQYYYAIVQGWI